MVRWCAAYRDRFHGALDRPVQHHTYPADLRERYQGVLDAEARLFAREAVVASWTTEAGEARDLTPGVIPFSIGMA